jgi:hypothetical protein
MVEQSLFSLLEILSSSSVGMDALTSQVAIFGVLQNAHACATTGDELGFEYVRMFIARLAQQTSDQAKVARVTEVLQKKLQDQVLRAFSQVQALGKLLPSAARQSDGKIASNKQSNAPAQQVAVEKRTHTPNVSVKPTDKLRSIQPAPNKNAQMQAPTGHKTATKAVGTESLEPRQVKANQPEETVRNKSTAQDDRVLGSHVYPSGTVEQPNVSHGRPHHHVYPCTTMMARTRRMLPSQPTLETTASLERTSIGPKFPIRRNVNAYRVSLAAASIKSVDLLPRVRAVAVVIILAQRVKAALSAQVTGHNGLTVTRDRSHRDRSQRARLLQSPQNNQQAHRAAPSSTRH